MKKQALLQREVAPGRAEPRFGGGAQVSPGARQVLQLQALIGRSTLAASLNRVAELARDSTRLAGQRNLVEKIGNPAQCKLKCWKPGSSLNTEKEKLAAEGADLISRHVDQAHAELEENNLSDTGDAFKGLYLLRLKEFSERSGGKKGMHPSTAAGYVIESKVTKRLAGQEGFNFQDTGLLNGTRPDVSIDLGDGCHALVDITAQNSLGHIFDKKGNWSKHKHIPYVAEAWYPSMNFRGKTSSLSPEQIRMAEEAAERKKELSELIELETLRHKTEVFLAAQTLIFNKLLSAGTNAIKLLIGKKRDLSALNAVGVDIGEGGETVERMTIQGRNTSAGQGSRVTPMNPVPGYSESQKEKALRVIELAKRASGRRGELKVPKLGKERKRSRYSKKR